MSWGEKVLCVGCLAAVFAPKFAAQKAAVRIHAGPVYTQGDDRGPYPRYPEMEIQVEVPPGTDPGLLRSDAFLLRYDPNASAGASKVRTLGATSYGAAAAFALDVSGSMKGAPLEAVRNGLAKFVADASAQDKIAIETIANDARWDTNWEDSRDKARASLAHLAVRGNLTRLWDGVVQAVGRYPSAPLSRRLVVISDGHDEGSVHHLQEAIDAAKANGVVIDAIGLTRSGPAYLQSLNHLAAETGGTFRRANSTAELEGLVGQGIEQLRSTPVVTFRLNDLKADGKAHRLEVVWKHNGVEFRDETTVTPPGEGALAKWKMYWLTGVGFLLGIIACAVLMQRRRERTRLPAHPPISPVAATHPAVARIPTIVQPPPGARAQPPLQSSPPPAPAVASRSPARRAKTEFLARFSPPSHEHPGAWLFGEEGPAAGKELPLVLLESWIGALDTNQLQVPGDETVSENHCCFVFEHDILSVYDNHSTNGTWVNGEQLRGARKLLRPADRVRVGRSTFAVEAVARTSGAA